MCIFYPFSVPVIGVTAADNARAKERECFYAEFQRTARRKTNANAICVPLADGSSISSAWRGK